MFTSYEINFCRNMYKYCYNMQKEKKAVFSNYKVIRKGNGKK